MKTLRWIAIAVIGLTPLHGQYTPPVASRLASGSLSSAQILALNTVPITVIPVPGAGNIVVIESFTAQLVAGGTAYSGTGVLQVQNTTPLSLGISCNATFLTGTVNKYCFAGPTTSNTGVSSTSFVNQGIVLSMTTAQDTLGTGTISYWIRYHIQSGF